MDNDWFNARLNKLIASLSYHCMLNWTQAGILLWMSSANGRGRYVVTSSLIGWAHAPNDPCTRVHLVGRKRVNLRFLLDCSNHFTLQSCCNFAYFGVMHFGPEYWQYLQLLTITSVCILVQNIDNIHNYLPSLLYVFWSRILTIFTITYHHFCMYIYIYIYVYYVIESFIGSNNTSVVEKYLESHTQTWWTSLSVFVNH